MEARPFTVTQRSFQESSGRAGFLNRMLPPGILETHAERPEIVQSLETRSNSRTPRSDLRALSSI
jgi:hypothetical protein